MPTARDYLCKSERNEISGCYCECAKGFDLCARTWILAHYGTMKQAVKNGDIFLWVGRRMEQDGYRSGESVAFDFENEVEPTYQGKIAGSFM